MKILQVTFNLSSGGGERFVVDLSNELSRSEDVILVQIQSNDDPHNAHYLSELNSRVKYINLGFKEGASWGVMKAIYRTIKAERPDVVNAHCTLLPLAMAAVLLKKPLYFHTLHSLAERCLGTAYLKPLYKYLYKNKVKAINISDICNESYERLYNLHNAIVINNGRSPVIPSNLLEDVKREVEGLKLHEDDNVFIHVGRFHPVKNHKLLLETFKRLIEEGEHVVLLVVGNGFEGHEEYNNDFCNGIYFIGEKKNVGDYLICSDCFVMSSLKEGLPISLLEAMSVGLIPVSTPAGGVCDVIVNYENGYLSKSHDMADFYEAVKDSIGNVANITKERIINDYNEKYSMKACSEHYRELYHAGKTHVVAMSGGGINIP